MAPSLRTNALAQTCLLVLPVMASDTMVTALGGEKVDITILAEFMCWRVDPTEPGTHYLWNPRCGGLDENWLIYLNAWSPSW